MSRKRKRGAALPTRKAPEPESIVVEPASGGNPYQGFDMARVAVANSFATLTTAVKPTLNQLLSWIGELEDPRWDEIFSNLDQANTDFNALYRSLGRVLGHLDPGNIESEVGAEGERI